ncbi:hypothetical protein KIPB_000531 [Kipferlia bialata]|uniref:Uncharacterized protein n=1 Tax=Kipferlia bialata TaxID=797122 RepID=A0A9K3CMH4_9EUKA|nr:hypothetical protein KIPB_000531 [Kipferlia bialata]|eukprot:g531.t1
MCHFTKDRFQSSSRSTLFCIVDIFRLGDGENPYATGLVPVPVRLSDYGTPSSQTEDHLPSLVVDARGLVQAALSHLCHPLPLPEVTYYDTCDIVEDRRGYPWIAEGMGRALPWFHRDPANAE